MIKYHDLGIRPFINASGTITTLGGSIMPVEVLDAMREASRSFVDLNELHEKAGRKLAELIGVPDAFVSCGAASGMQLSAAACITGTDLERITRLPHTEGMKNEFVISLLDPHTYIHQGIETSGGKLVRVGTEDAVSTRDILDGIGPDTAAVVHFLGRQTKEQLGEVLEGTLDLAVPVIVDAAAQLPPRSNLTEILEMGADLVVFSGGKGIQGPQCSGLVLGKEEMIEAVRLNSSPYSAVGRGMKVGKEEIMGLLAAVELFLQRDEAIQLQQWKDMIGYIADQLRGIPEVEALVENDPGSASPSIVDRLYVQLKSSDENIVEVVVRALKEGNPSIDVRSTTNGICIDPMTLISGEEKIIGKRLSEILRRNTP